MDDKIILTEIIAEGDMQTALYFAERREDALACVQQLCDDIKANEEANHQLYFSTRFMGAYVICKGEEVDGTKKLTGNHEVIIFPAQRTEDLERLQRTKHIISCKNCMCLVGEGPKAKDNRAVVISWLLNS